MSSKRKQWKLARVRAAAKAAVDAGWRRDGVTVSTRGLTTDCFSVRSDSYSALGAIAEALEGEFNVRAVRHTSGPGEGHLMTEIEGSVWTFRHVAYFTGGDDE